jgi:type II secretory ATPase GspE/PulE/Tfp pilus assembly ATPase PilB-like protein
MITLWQNGLRRVLKGETTIEEILRVLAADAF